mmetsp:Transcript_7438/g.17978  ORF Transcript_7438/g.17978 Transcript_7438/m.17978 type:complete len:519 (+) Transcript_7438:287-1843(+)|eukprot:CAMPEP_0178991270 /NCGR_PEP_ID=MMETSP0795-20121207/5426_1 /TAXON_ID=88552 /ORGANISM="Amoebophrya sp., Strain Ameob2" /LENGTH=518 /DNA_ID=CAMNT_0020682943 /DNA_START=283 /DNA_END=1839 /DNA_ORIENTATION=+
MLELPAADDPLFGLAAWEKRFLQLPVVRYLPHFGYVGLGCVHCGVAPIVLLYQLVKKARPSIATAAILGYLQVFGDVSLVHEADVAEPLRRWWKPFAFVNRAIPIFLSPLRVIFYFSSDEARRRNLRDVADQHAEEITTERTKAKRTDDAEANKAEVKGHTISFTEDFLHAVGYYNEDGSVRRKPQSEDGQPHTTQEQTYLFATHPHGVLNCVNGSAFGYCGWRLRSVLGDGFRSRLGGLEQVFTIPVLREFLLFFYGCCSADARTMLHQLREKKRSVALVVGGARESLWTEFEQTDTEQGQGRVDAPSTTVVKNKMRLVLADRKGFVRIAVLAQSPLVPVLGFGENSLYRQTVVSPRLRGLIYRFQAATGVGLPLVRGGLKLFPALPRTDVPLTSCFGKPVGVRVRRSVLLGMNEGDRREDVDPFLTGDEIRRLPEPLLQRVVDEVHAEYILAVKKLHAETAPRYGTPADQELEIISSAQATDIEYYKQCVGLPEEGQRGGEGDIQQGAAKHLRAKL